MELWIQAVFGGFPRFSGVGTPMQGCLAMLLHCIETYRVQSFLNLDADEPFPWNTRSAIKRQEEMMTYEALSEDLTGK
jgi:hypothetical protein